MSDQDGQGRWAWTDRWERNRRNVQGRSWNPQHWQWHVLNDKLHAVGNHAVGLRRVLPILVLQTRPPTPHFGHIHARSHTPAHVYPARYARTHFPMPRRFLSKPAAFYVYLFFLLFLCMFFWMRKSITGVRVGGIHLRVKINGGRVPLPPPPPPPPHVMPRYYMAYKVNGKSEFAEFQIRLWTSTIFLLC